MEFKEPWKIWPMNFEKYIQQNLIQEVTSVLVYEPSTTMFHPDGLYSEIIFGQIGTPSRIAALGYINLNCKVLAPLIYVNLMKVAPWYKDIIDAKIHVKFDDKLKEFIIVDKEDPEANTGYQYFIDHVDRVTLKENTSRSRTNKIKMIYEARDTGTLFTTKMLVAPAGWRDVKVNSSGRTEIDVVNKLYSSLIIAAKEINTSVTSPLLISMFDKIKIHVQLKVVEIFDYWKTFYEGKTGFGKEHYAKRSLADGTRNVITASPLLASSPDDPSFMKHNDTQVPLYQCAKAYVPLVTFSLNMLFYSTIFTEGSTSILAIDPDTLESKYIEVDPSVVTYALSSQSKKDFIDSFIDITMRGQPVSITDITGKEYYLWMVYDTGNEICAFRGINELQQFIKDDNKDLESLDISGEDFDRVITKLMVYLRDREGWDVSHLAYKIDPRPHNEDGTTTPGVYAPKDVSPGDWTKDGIVYIRPINILKEKLKELNITNLTPKQFFCHMVIHEACHEVWWKVFDEQQRKDHNLAIPENFTTPYLETFDKTSEEYQIERFCEYIATVFDNSGYFDNSGDPTNIDQSLIRPMTNVEMLYIATYGATREKFLTITRYPAVEKGSIYPSRSVVVSTVPDRVVTFKSPQGSNADTIMPHYPVMGTEQYQDSVMIHPGRTPGLGADYDGDKVSVNGIMTTEATKEAMNYINSTGNYIGVSGKMDLTLGTMATKYVIHALTRVNGDPPKIEK